MTYFEKFCEERDIKEETIKGYQGTINKYTRYQGKNLDDLIQEAINEERERIPQMDRTIKTRFLDFRTFLMHHENLKMSTVQKHMGNLRTLYSHRGIELPKLPPVKAKNVSVKTTYLDLPNRNDISRAIKSTGIRLASMILVMSSGGIGRTECVNMTVGDFIEACKGYYKSETIPEIIDELAHSIEDIVPTFNILRVKTQKRYYAFCSPQATQAVLEWLLLIINQFEVEGKELTLEESLWGWDIRDVTYQFTRLNDELNLGYARDGYRVFRPHNLRKFNSSNIGLSPETIDLLHGRSQGKIHEAYIKTNPEELKKVYMTALDNVYIKDFGKKEIHHDEYNISINVMMMGSENAISI